MDFAEAIWRTFVVVGFISLAIGAFYIAGQLEAQPQPPIPEIELPGTWFEIKGKAGVSWYVRGEAITEIMAIPEDLAEKYGARTRVVGHGIRIELDKGVNDVEVRRIPASQLPINIESEQADRP